ncbi:MAG TPA: SRPBCC family protein, partial [Micromonosporaceae bacterium]
PGANGWTYSDWVVGTAHIRAVDEQWPAPGTAIYHKAGPWPLSVQDKTVSLRCEPPHLLILSPRMWPLGQAKVELELTEVRPDTTEVRLPEDFEAGPLRWLRTKVNDLVLHRRNRELLRRLAELAIRRAHPAEQPTVDIACRGR